MIFLSSLLREITKYKPAAARITAALDTTGIHYRFLNGTRDIWIRDFMPVRRKDGRYVSFRYEPSYLKGYSHLETDFKRDISRQFYDLMQASGSDSPQDIILCSDINLDGGNVILSPSGNKAIVSNRLFTENAGRDRSGLIRQLEEQLAAHVIVIPSDPDDMTGHADGMVRFLDEDTVVGNNVVFQNGLEQRIKVFSDYRYYPNQLIYNKLKEALDREGLSHAGLKGPFWVDTDERTVLAYAVSQKVSPVPSHKEAWELLRTPKHSWNYYPRGRVEIRRDKAVVFAHPLCFEFEELEGYLRFFFHLRDLPIEYKADNSGHYTNVFS